MTLIDDYLELQEKYEKKFGEKTIVLMQVGGFFEIYGVVFESVSEERYVRCEYIGLRFVAEHVAEEENDVEFAGF